MQNVSYLLKWYDSGRSDLDEVYIRPRRRSAYIVVSLVWYKSLPTSFRILKPGDELREESLGSVREKFTVVEVEAREADYMIRGDLQHSSGIGL